jgi:hypothetical protein
MVKESKNVDFLTTGRQPSEEEFVRISEWIKKNKKKKVSRKKPNLSFPQKQLTQH